MYINEADIIVDTANRIRAITVTRTEVASSSVINMLLDQIVSSTRQLEKKAYITIRKPTLFSRRK